MRSVMFVTTEAFQDVGLCLRTVVVPCWLHTGRKNSHPLASTPNLELACRVSWEI